MTYSRFARLLLFAMVALATAGCAGDPHAGSSPEEFIVLRVDSFG